MACWFKTSRSAFARNVLMRMAVRSIAPILILVLYVTHAASESATPGRIVGRVDGIARDGAQRYLEGWACQQGQTKPIRIEVAVKAVPSSLLRTDVAVGLANGDDEPAVDTACNVPSGGTHRFSIVLPRSLHTDDPSLQLYVNGNRIVDGVPNSELAGSGQKLTRLPALSAAHADLPHIAGAYRSSQRRPRVFYSPMDITTIVARIDQSDGYSRSRFRDLANRVAHDLTASIDWNAVYGGCRVKTYLFAFSYEPQEPSFLMTLHADLQPRAGTRPSAGAAVVAARLALYAALVRAGAVLPADAPAPAAAAALSARILLAWSDRGFRSTTGGYRNLSSFNCDDMGSRDTTTSAGTGLPLALGRGIIYSVDAEDLLESIDALSRAERARLDSFHRYAFDLIRQSSNAFEGTNHVACERYADGQMNALAALFAVARLLDDPHALDSVMTGRDPRRPLLVPFDVEFDHAIYGDRDHPAECNANSGATGPTSHPSFQTVTVDSGEIIDRYRNATPLQGMGYPMFTLQRLIDIAELLRASGFDPYGYHGQHGQSITKALDFYACYGQQPGFSAVVTHTNASACGNVAQYEGKIVDGVDQMSLFGTFRFPNDEALTRVEQRARTASATSAFALDPILFGRWRN